MWHRLHDWTSCTSFGLVGFGGRKIHPRLASQTLQDTSLGAPLPGSQRGFFPASGNSRCLSAHWDTCGPQMLRKVHWFGCVKKQNPPGTQADSSTCQTMKCAPQTAKMSRSRCQVLVAGDSLELFDIDLGEQKWAVQPDGHVQVTVGLGSPLKRQLILGQECYDGPVPEPVPRGFIYYII